MPGIKELQLEFLRRVESSSEGRSLAFLLTFSREDGVSLLEEQGKYIDKISYRLSHETPALVCRWLWPLIAILEVGDTHRNLKGSILDLMRQEYSDLIEARASAKSFDGPITRKEFEKVEIGVCARAIWEYKSKGGDWRSIDGTLL